MNRPPFLQLVRAYQRVNERGAHGCNLKMENTCAIRLSEALVSVDRSWLRAFRRSPHKRCPHDYMRGAQDLAAVLRNEWGGRDEGWSKPGRTPRFNGSGVICYMRIPTFPEGSGHIDMWFDGRPVGSEYWNATTVWFWRL